MLDCPPLLALSDPKRASHADVFWRIARPYARLAERGIDARVCWLGAYGQPDISPEGRIVLIQRTAFMQSNPVTGTIEAGELQARCWVRQFREAGALAVVAELDDDTLSDAYLDWLDASGGLELVKRRRLLNERQAWRYTVAACDAVTVSTEPLAEVVRRYTDKPVIVVPNAIDVEWFTSRLVARPAWAEHLTIGWAGGRRPDADLEPMAVAWGRIAKRYPEVRFVVGGWQPDCIYREVEDIDRIIRVPWQGLEDWPSVMQVSIGCTPLADTPFNRCKSAIKAWEYSLAGAAVVSSRVVYGEPLAGISSHFTADTVDEWENAIAGYIEYPDLRRAYQEDCRRLLVSVFGMIPERDPMPGDARRGVHRWAEAYREIAAGAGKVLA